MGLISSAVYPRLGNHSANRRSSNPYLTNWLRSNFREPVVVTEFALDHDGFCFAGDFDDVPNLGSQPTHSVWGCPRRPWHVLRNIKLKVFRFPDVLKAGFSFLENIKAGMNVSGDYVPNIRFDYGPKSLGTIWLVPDIESQHHYCCLGAYQLLAQQFSLLTLQFGLRTGGISTLKAGAHDNQSESSVSKENNKSGNLNPKLYCVAALFLLLIRIFLIAYGWWNIRSGACDWRGIALPLGSRMFEFFGALMVIWSIRYPG
jgi:hypothetical protein